LGRSCRFLQPKVAVVNDVVNATELHRLRDFTYNAPAGNGSFTNFLLLNERGDTGERFWNLLRMAVVVIKEPPPSRTSHRYIVGLQTSMNIGLLAGLRYPSTTVEKEHAIATSKETRSFTAVVDKIRYEIRLMEEHGRSLQEQEAFASKKLRSWLKANTEDFIGDHYCPQIICRLTDEFRRGLTEIRLLEAMGRDQIRQLCGKSVEVEDVVTQKFDTCFMTVSDTTIADSPLVYVSPAFERLSGYGRDFCIGRNVRFMWPTEEAIHTLFNQSEIDSMMKFLPSDGADEGEFWFGFMLNVDSKGAPFWSLQTVRKIMLDGKVFIVGFPHRFGCGGIF
jgi:PAS domain-containing protein